MEPPKNQSPLLIIFTHYEKNKKMPTSKMEPPKNQSPLLIIFTHYKA